VPTRSEVLAVLERFGEDGSILEAREDAACSKPDRSGLIVDASVDD